ncbi:response regulator [Spirosoma arboris]|uniref:response regulator n=1 Tax=Spirosoma arboris TaxID=2682092 RepID=UPI00293BE50F|nr:response regulator [Spirosoma arboris]
MTANYKNATILIAEANEDQWRLIQEAIRQQLPTVKAVQASSLPQAMKLLEGWRQQEWDMAKLLLLDPHLPQLTDGWHLLRWMKAMSASIRQIPVVVLSYSEAQADINEAYQLGASSYLVKPTELADWLTCLGALRAYWWETVTLPPVHYGFE